LTEQKSSDAGQYAEGLRKVRKRRWFLWSLILIYLPAIWVSLQVTQSDAKTFIVFGIWFILVCIAGSLAALVKCPRCGNYFHMNGVMPLYLRKCLHCGLHVCADKKS